MCSEGLSVGTENRVLSPGHTVRVVTPLRAQLTPTRGVKRADEKPAGRTVPAESSRLSGGAGEAVPRTRPNGPPKRKSTAGTTGALWAGRGALARGALRPHGPSVGAVLSHLGSLLRPRHPPPAAGNTGSRKPPSALGHGDAACPPSSRAGTGACASDALRPGLRRSPSPWPQCGASLRMRHRVPPPRSTPPRCRPACPPPP